MPLEPNDLDTCADYMTPLARKLLSLSTNDKVEFLIFFIQRFCNIFEDHVEPDDTIIFANKIAPEMQLTITDDMIGRWLTELGWGEMIEFEGEQLFQTGDGIAYQIQNGIMFYCGEIHRCKFCHNYARGTITTRINGVFGYACQTCRLDDAPVVPDVKLTDDDDDDDAKTVVLY